MRRGPWKLVGALASMALAVLLLVGCGGTSAHSEEDAPLRVYAAASLTEAVNVLAQFYDRPLTANFGSSSALARQIQDGAPADVFLSVSPRWIEVLGEAGHLAGPPRTVARNVLVAVAPRGSDLASARIDGPDALARHLRPGDGVAIADPGVPAGEYARAALRSAGLLESLRPHWVGHRDVRATLRAVEQRQLSAGFVYATDARVAPVEVLFTFSSQAHPPIEYQAVALRGAADPREAEAFLAFLQGDLAKTLLVGLGFLPPLPEDTLLTDG